MGIDFLKSFVDRRRVTLLILAMVFIFGFFAYLKIPKESTPDVRIPVIYTIVTLEGISPEDSERLLIKPLEKNMRSIDGIKQMTAYANEGSAQIFLEFFAGFDNKKALADVRAASQDSESDFPLDAKKPTIHEVNLSLFPVLNVILTGDVPERALLTMARDLKTKILQLQGILSVNIGGDRDDSLEIIVKPDVMEAYNLSTDLFRTIVSQNNQLIAAGSIRSDTGEFSVKVPSLIKTYQDLHNFPVKYSNGTVVKLGDIAQIRRTYKDAVTTARVNGNPAVVLEVSKRTGENIIDTVSRVKNLVDKESKYWPSQLKIEYTNDESKRIITMLSDLENNILFAVLLVVIVVIISVGARSALLISLSIPASFFAGILILSAFGLTLNIVVLFSLILTVGMIVDDAIVVSEYADRLMLQGVPVGESFLISAHRMLWPITTSTLVKIVVFLPLLVWPGVVGQFMQYMPITVIAILSSSLLFALFFQPTLGPLFGAPKHLKVKDVWDIEDVDHVDVNKLNRFTKFYYDKLILVLKMPKLFVASIISILVAVYAFFILFGTGMEFFPKVEPDNSTVAIISPGNLSLHERDEIVKKVEARILKLNKDISVVYSKAGNFDASSSTPEDTIGLIALEYHEWFERRKSKEILHDILENLSDINGIKVEIMEKKPGPPPEKPVQINITSHDFANANKVADALLNFMKKDGSYIKVEDSRSNSAIEWHINADREKAAQYGIDLGVIGNTIRLITNGLKVSSYRPDDVDDEVDILVRFPEEYRSITNLEGVNIVSSDGKHIPISNFVTKTAEPKLNKIKKIDGEKVVSIKADVISGVLVDTKVKEIKAMIAEQKLYEKASITFKGEAADQKEASDFLMRAFIITLIAMFAIMLMQFNSYYHTFIIMSAVFLSTVGVLIGLLLAGQPFGVVMCGVGIIALGGIVLNNNILFIDTYQHLRKLGLDVEDAILGAGVQRLRPILLTALTAILGLLPMVFGLTIDFMDRSITYDSPASQWWRQLSASIAGGLSFATILTLFFTPCLLLIGKRFDRKY